MPRVLLILVLVLVAAALTIAAAAAVSATGLVPPAIAALSGVALMALALLVRFLGGKS
ncbi:hypothetical protein OEZ71_03080 [Defluviimonas sp. WL0050]|uniref:Uncharacterized protein n=1 Tax=Albidovulum litorale TaxID=2984134 RepID=A0ABT2ZJH5_9RHOB|nr:hypothetical protein [Defluviimonas sp. WL0050]MCV2871274.1 hypothetical protein [Defluviimonas sp. WL0050]